MNEFEDMKDIYGALLSIHRKQPDEILAHAEHIADQAYKNYYMAYGYLLKGDFIRADEYPANVNIPWMIHTLRTIAAKQHGKFEDFKAEGYAAIESAQGIQRYITYHTIRRLEAELA